jgi:hypothetical protein
MAQKPTLQPYQTTRREAFLLNHNPPLLEEREREHSFTSKGSRRLDKPAAFGVQF